MDGDKKQTGSCHHWVDGRLGQVVHNQGLYRRMETGDEEGESEEGRTAKGKMEGIVDQDGLGGRNYPGGHEDMSRMETGEEEVTVALLCIALYCIVLGWGLYGTS